MAKLEFSIKGPFQAYGPNNGITFLDFKPTGFEPQKSHVIGMIAAGLGVKRNSEELVFLTNNLQVNIKNKENNSSRIYHDYQTVAAQGTDFGTKRLYRKRNSVKYITALEYHGYHARPEDLDCLPSADGKLNKVAHTKIIKKDYLVNCEFDIEVVGEKSVLEKVKQGLMHPYYPLYLGRKNCIATKIKVGEIL